MVFEGAKEYEWARGSVHKASAQAAGEMCLQLASEGRLTAKDLLDANRSENDPLYVEFEWDDSVAGEKYRIKQAEQIIRHVIVKTIPRVSNGPVRAFFHTTKKRGEYTPIEAIVNSPDQMETLLEQAKRELRAFQKKYEILSDLEPVFNAIDDLLADDQEGGKAI